METGYSYVQDPKVVQRYQTEGITVLRLIDFGRSAYLSDGAMEAYLVKALGMIPQYARNCIEEYESEAAAHTLPWEYNGFFLDSPFHPSYN